MSAQQPAVQVAESTPMLAERVIEYHDRFLSFIVPRVGSRALAEDILQSAYVKAMEHQHELRSEDSTVAWFYRILRNAITDNFRRQDAQTRAHEGFAAEAPLTYEPELEATVCACIGDVVQELKPEYRNAIEQVDLGGLSVQEFARRESTTANNASVRLHRARKDVAKRLIAVCGSCAEHKCLDCTCKRSQL
jgi:RNA polymerase sigma factor (sigma-70 family)